MALGCGTFPARPTPGQDVDIQLAAQCSYRARDAAGRHDKIPAYVVPCSGGIWASGEMPTDVSPVLPRVFVPWRVWPAAERAAERAGLGSKEPLL